MEKIFDIKRFGKYLAYDIRNAKNNYLLSLIICSLLPAFIYVCVLLGGKVFTGNWGKYSAFIQYSSLFAAYITIVLTFPAKVYGKVTEKRYGSDFLMLPASSFEKWLSMIIISCLILPICFGAVFFGTDALLTLTPGFSGHSILTSADWMKDKWLSETNNVLDIKLGPVCYLSWCESILTFCLGAIFFKKAKAGKTILANFALSIAYSFATMGIIGDSNIESFYNSSFAKDPEAITSMFNSFSTFIWTNYIVLIVLILGALYARIKTMKH